MFGVVVAHGKRVGGRCGVCWGVMGCGGGCRGIMSCGGGCRGLCRLNFWRYINRARAMSQPYSIGSSPLRANDPNYSLSGL